MRVYLLPVSVKHCSERQALARKLLTTLQYRLPKEYAFIGRLGQGGLTAGSSSWKPRENMAVVVHSYRETDRQTHRQESCLESTNQLLLEYRVKQPQEALTQQGGKRTNSQKGVL